MQFAAIVYHPMDEQTILSRKPLMPVWPVDFYLDVCFVRSCLISFSRLLLMLSYIAFFSLLELRV